MISMTDETGAPIGAHELIVMNEALMTKAANAELFSHLAEHVQSEALRNLLEEQARAVLQHYAQGTELLQHVGHTLDSLSFADVGSYRSQFPMAGAEPKLGLRHPSQSAPNLGGNALSERTVCSVVLNTHKHGAIAWMTCALECTQPDLRSYLVSGALMCDRAAYEIWSYMNQKGYYQVPTLLAKTADTMINAFKTPAHSGFSSPASGHPSMSSFHALDATSQINPNESNQFYMH